MDFRFADSSLLVFLVLLWPSTNSAQGDSWVNNDPFSIGAVVYFYFFFSSSLELDIPEPTLYGSYT